MNKASPGLSVTGGLPSTLCSSDPSRKWDDLLARMGVPRRMHSRVQRDSHLNHHASRDVEIVALEIGARESWLLCSCHVRHQTACGDQRYCGHASYRCHVALFW
jgi:hypothetical protein